MARLLKEIEWLDPVISPLDDPAWDAECKRAMGTEVPAFRYTARSPWVRAAKLHNSQVRSHVAPKRLAWLAILVTSQENSCRFCYGTARMVLKVLGLDDRQLESVERDLRMAGADEGERALLEFCRNLSRSTPRPARSDVEALVARGFDPKAVTEIAGFVGLTCFNNRVATFVAVPLDTGVEGFSPGLFTRLLMKMFGAKYPRPLQPPASGAAPVPFSRVVDLVEGTEAAWVLAEALQGAFASTVLPVRTKAWVFAVVARALACELCEREAGRVLEEQGVPAERRESVLRSLTGPELDETEAILLPWVRETAHYQTEVMQRKTRELRDRLGEDIALDAIGLAALANTCARLSMLAL